MKQERQPHRSSVAAFTLVEMLLVVGIIALLVGSGLYKMSDVREGTRIQAAKAKVSKLQSDVLAYELDNGMYPTTEQGLKALVERPSGNPQPRNWRQIRQYVPVDPWQNEYQYAYPGRQNPRQFEIYSYGPDGQPGTADDISSQDDR